MKFDFFRGNECEQYLFYRVPQVLFTDDEFRYISSEAKLLYGFLLDRTALSAKNKWTDEDGKVYVYFTQDEAKEKLNIGTGKATKIFSELDEIGLIIRIRQGQGNPCKIYVMNFAKPLSQAQTSENQKSEKNKNEYTYTTADNTVYNNVRVDILGEIKNDSITSIEVQNNTPKKLIITENKNFDLRSFFIVTTYEYTFV